MRESKVRTMLLASVMIMLCTSVIVGGTYALWSDNVAVNNHLSAGSLKVELKRTYLEKYVLGDDGYFGDPIKDNTETSTTANMFEISDDEVFVPMTYYAARLKLTNIGDVAFNYVINIEVDKNSDVELAKQVIVHVGDKQKAIYDEAKGYSMSPNDQDCQYLAKETTNGNVDYLTYEIGSGSMDNNVKETEFWVEILYGDFSDNNSSQNKKLSFDLLIKATQATHKVSN